MMLMAALLPLISWTALLFILHARGQGWRPAVLGAAVAWGAFLTAVTELLSLFKLLTFGWLVGCWAFLSLTLIIIYFWFTHARPTPPHAKTPSEIPRSSALLLMTVVLIVAAIGLVASLAPPNNWDSMTYHMSRVAHWAQNHTVAHYPTAIIRQLIFSPWAEFAILHLQLLSGSDRLANLVQWLSLLGSLVGVSLIAKHLGADSRGQILAVVLCATLPMGIVQGSSTQNDATAAFWLICLVYFLLLMGTRLTWASSCAAGISLGLALLTKATAYLIAPPFAAWFVLSQLRTLRSGLWKYLGVMVILALSLNLGHYVRNISTFGHLLDPGRGITGYESVNESMSVPLFVSNVVRNVAVHISTPSWRLNRAAEKGVDVVHRVLGVAINDPRTTFEGTEFHLVEIPILHEDFAGNPFHLILAISILSLLAISRRRSKSWGLITAYAAAVLAGFLLVSLYLKWTPWNSRYQLPLFMLASPFIGFTLANHLSRRITNAIAVALMLAALPWVVCNRTRPLVGAASILHSTRVSDYFRNRPDLKEAYVGATAFVHARRCSQVGLDFGGDGDGMEYPFWVLLQADQPEGVRIEHVPLKSGPRAGAPGGVYPPPRSRDFRPCAIIAVDSRVSEIETSEDAYDRAWSSKPVSVFVRK